MRRTLTCGLVLLCCLVAQPLVAQSTSPIQGSFNGVEICPQSICGAATFVGRYAGKVNGKLAFGVWLLAVEHENYSDDQILPPPGESIGILGGTWRLNVFVLDRWRFRRTRFGGTVEPWGTLTHQGSTEPTNFYDVVATLNLLVGGTGTVELVDAVLDENQFPPRLSGLLE